VGKGSTFFAVLPRLAAANPAVPDLAPRLPAPAADAPTVLVVEDDAGDLARLAHTLSDAGYAVTVATSGAEAKALCAARKFDVITLDLMLPDMSGQAVLAGLAADGPNATTPVVVVTVAAGDSLAAGYQVHEILSKPFEVEALLASLRRARGTPTGSPVIFGAEPAHGG
jgi:CheY-like chemotaxis protein